jgi:hypothetical protein
MLDIAEAALTENAARLRLDVQALSPAPPRPSHAPPGPQLPLPTHPGPLWGGGSASRRVPDARGGRQLMRKSRAVGLFPRHAEDRIAYEALEDVALAVQVPRPGPAPPSGGVSRAGPGLCLAVGRAARRGEGLRALPLERAPVGVVGWWGTGRRHAGDACWV